MAESVALLSLFDDARRFLSELARNNDRDWFAAHKTRYDAELKRPAERLLVDLGPCLGALAGMPVRGKLFRPHRDVRFSEDKTPYHTHLHLLWTAADGRGWFFGLSPDYASAGAGVMAFPEDQLARWRDALDGPGGARLARLLEKGGWRLGPPELTHVPAPFPADHPQEALLRRKGLLPWEDGLEAPLQEDPRAALEAAFTRLAPVPDWLGRHVTT